ncbi:MAG: hypothetical protein Q9218_007766 [Villophora microphyllina]
MGYWKYLLIPFSPIIAIFCLLVFIYERLALNDEERVGSVFTISKTLSSIWDCVYFVIVVYPAILLHLCSPRLGLRHIILIAPLSATLSLWIQVWRLLRIALWYPLFREIVPACYFFWNSRVYHDLQKGSQQIRVVKLLPGASSARVEAKLMTIDIHSQLNDSRYEALSYSWGGHLMLRRVITLNKRSYLVADTVFNALKELRLAEKERLLWIDAICINQGNREEKGRQVALMDSIYRNAQKVIVWLGKGSEQIDSAFRIVQKVKTPPPKEFNSIRDSLVSITCARWWSRVWIVQEVALAPRVVVRSGSNEMSWETLTACFRRLSSSRDPKDLLDEKILAFINAIAKIKHSDHHQARSLVDLAIRFRDRVAGNPRDKLLGYLGLTNQPADSLIVDNPYGKTTAEFYAHFAASCIKSTGSLAMITIAEGLSTDKNTWVVDWTMMTSQEWRDHDPLADGNKSSREPPTPFWNGKLLPSVSEKSGRKYSASQNLRAVYKQGPSWDLLHLTGWIADGVESCGDRFEDAKDTAKIIRNWEKLAGGPWKNETDPRRADFIRTLVGDTWQGIAPQDWPERLQHLLTNDGSHAAILKGERDVEAQNHSAKDGSGLLSFEQLIYVSCFRRRFFITKKGRFGLGPTSTWEDYEVCIILGSQVPFLLSQPEPKKPYIFAGQAYVDGLMDYKGNLLEDIAAGKITTHEYVIK